MPARPAAVRVSDVASPKYERRKPETTVLYRIVSEHIETFLAESRSHDGPGLPKYVEQELRSYLECGILAHGFLHAKCKSCGEELVVAFSCKRRGCCPSCNARRMCTTAAHLVDSVFPDVPLRQWVLSVPFELRLLLARRADAFSALIRIFAREVLGWQKAQSAFRRVRGGGASFPQRFGGSLNLNTHVHAVFPDGLFVEPIGAGAAAFVGIRPPGPDDLARISEAVSKRFVRWLKKEGLLRGEPENESNERPEESALDACARMSLGVGELTGIDDRGRASSSRGDPDDQALLRARKGKHVGEANGFQIHAGVTIATGNTFGREVLFRYCARPPLALDRLSLLPDGRVAYRLKTPWSADRTHRVMTPLQFMARLAALVPPPRHPLIRFHGVFAPHFSWRSAVVPQRLVGMEPTKTCSTRPVPADDEREAAPLASENEERSPTGERAAVVSTEPVGQAEPRSAEATEAKTCRWYIDWATLLKRVHGVDALACPCGGRLRFIAIVEDVKETRLILERLGLSPEASPVARARDPTDCIDPIVTDDL